MAAGLRGGEGRPSRWLPPPAGGAGGLRVRVQLDGGWVVCCLGGGGRAVRSVILTDDYEAETSKTVEGMAGAVGLERPGLGRL